MIGQLFSQEIKNHYLTKKTSPFYKQILDVLRFPKTVKNFEDFGRSVSPYLDLAEMCPLILGPYMDLIRQGATADEVGESVMELCTMLNISTERVCRGAIFLNVGTIWYIVKERPNLTVAHLCAFFFQQPDSDFSDFEWSVQVDANKPALTGSKDTSVFPSSSDLTFAQITDPHYDPSYQAGSWASCDEYNCCRNDQPIPADVDAAVAGAGRWGDYRDCDSPLEAVIDAFSQIRRNHPRLDYVYFTGDIVDHAIWATTIAHCKYAINRVNKLLKDIFAGVPVYPVLGNHEAHPVNLFAPDNVPQEYSTNWLYEYVAEEWKAWLPEDALRTVRLGGYYTLLARPGFRIVAINNNDCYTFNWWIAYKPDAAKVQLQWLHDTLLAAERNNEKVHILGHVPPGTSGCNKIYAREYRRIVERFWNTISAQFAGHSHNDEFNIFYSRDNPSQALNVLWNGGSTTAYSDVNPNYKVYTMDTSTYQVNTHHTWIYNLTLANSMPNEAPRWFKEYDFTEEYKLNNLSPRALSELASNMARSPLTLKRVS